MAHTIIYLQHRNSTNQRGRRGKDLLRTAVNKAMGLLGGASRGARFTVVGSSTDLVAACTCGISSGGSGTVGLTISAVGLTDTWATDDTTSAGLVAAAVNASTNAKIQYLYGASNLKSSLTLVTVVAGDTVKISDWLFTAVAGTAAAIPAIDGQFVAKGAGTDTQSGTSLAGAINRHSSASKYLFALNVAGVVHVFPKAAAWWTQATAGNQNPPQNVVISNATTISVGSATFAASAYYGVYAKIPGKWGNGIVVAASGTGQSIENSNTYMSRGLGMDAAPVTDNT